MKNNYLLQAEQARRRFLEYDQEALIRKLSLPFDGDWLYATLLGSRYRLGRATGEIQRQDGAEWVPAGYHEVMTLLDLICDSRPDRTPAHRWRAMGDFGHRFHQTLLEAADPWAQAVQADPEGFRRACLALGGAPFPQGDLAYTLDLFDGLPLALIFRFGDEEFPPTLRLLWDENAPQYLKYETMYYAKALLQTKIQTLMATPGFSELTIDN